MGADDNPQPPDYPSLASHFVRRYFDDPVRVNWADSWVKSELAITYLLGLDWTYLARAKKLRQQDDKADSIVKGAKVRMEGWKKQTATLEAECAILKRKIDEAEAELARYNTIPHTQLRARRVRGAGRPVGQGAERPHGERRGDGAVQDDPRGGRAVQPHRGREARDQHGAGRDDARL